MFGFQFLVGHVPRGSVSVRVQVGWGLGLPKREGKGASRLCLQTRGEVGAPSPPPQSSGRAGQPPPANLCSLIPHSGSQLPCSGEQRAPARETQRDEGATYSQTEPEPQALIFTPLASKPESHILFVGSAGGSAGGQTQPLNH